MKHGLLTLNSVAHQKSIINIARLSKYTIPRHNFSSRIELNYNCCSANEANLLRTTPLR